MLPPNLRVALGEQYCNSTIKSKHTQTEKIKSSLGNKHINQMTTKIFQKFRAEKSTSSGLAMASGLLAFEMGLQEHFWFAWNIW